MKFNEILINNQDADSQIENDETPRSKYPNGINSENTEINKTSAILNLIPKI